MAKRVVIILLLLLPLCTRAQQGHLGPYWISPSLRVGGPVDSPARNSSLQVDGAARFTYYPNSDTNKVLSLDANGFLVWRTKGTDGGGSSYPGYGVIIRNDSLIVDTTQIATANYVYRAVRDTANNLRGWVNGLFTAYYTSAQVDAIIANYYTKTQSDARYLQTETDPIYTSEKSQYSKYADTGIAIATEYKRKRDSLLAATNNALKLPYSDTAQLLNNYNKALEKLGAGRNAKIYTCILRPSIDGSNNITWRFLGWSDDHDTLHAASITVNGTYLQVNFDTTCKRVLVCIATPDDDMGAAGVTIGCKGNLDNIQIYGSAPRGAWDGYFTWTGGTFTPEYAISDIIFDTSVSPTYSFKITNPTPMNPNYGNGLSYTSNYSGQNYARWSVQYMGNHGYTVSRLNDHYNPTFTVLDAAGNKVPNTAFTSTDLFMIKTGMDRRFSMSWNFNVNNFITSNSNIWLFAMMVTY